MVSTNVLLEAPSSSGGKQYKITWERNSANYRISVVWGKSSAVSSGGGQKRTKLDTPNSSEAKDMILKLLEEKVAKGYLIKNHGETIVNNPSPLSTLIFMTASMSEKNTTPAKVRQPKPKHISSQEVIVISRLGQTYTLGNPDTLERLGLYVGLGDFAAMDIVTACFDKAGTVVELVAN